MKRFLATTAIVCGALCASNAQAAHVLGDVVDVTGYQTPDGAAFGVVTTDGYSYYTGPITLDLSDGTTITVYCADLNHILQTGPYVFGLLTTDGTGTPISTSLSHRLGVIAEAGLAALAANNLDNATAAQAAIWDDEYSIPSMTGNATIGNDIFNFIAPAYAANTHYALALTPDDPSWPSSATASQQMVVGLLTVPEPASLGLLGLGLLGTIVAVSRRSA